VDALARALLGRVDHVEPEVLRNLGLAAGHGLQLAVGALDVGEAVDVELEHLRRVLHAQPVAGAQVLVHPDPKRLTHDCPPSLPGDPSPRRFPAAAAVDGPALPG
jgi:hypothetical protein